MNSKISYIAEPYIMLNSIAMKQRSLLCLILLFHTISAISQSCLPEGITFTKQEQIDNFKTDHPGCTEIAGFVIIRGDDINNLDGLDVLISIGNGLQIDKNPSLTDLSGLDNITSIGGWPYGGLFIAVNSALTSLAGLESLKSIGGSFYLTNNISLTSLAGLSHLDSIGCDLGISGNAALIKLTGLEGLTSVSNLLITSNPALTSLSALYHLTSCHGDLLVAENDALISLEGLEGASFGGGIEIVNNHSLADLEGLQGITSIGGSLYSGLHITGNYSLTGLEGLRNLITIESEMEIESNSTLSGLDGLENLTTVGSYIHISENTALTSLAGIDNIAPATVTELNLTGNTSLSECDVRFICDYLALQGASVLISGNASGCNSAGEVADACEAGMGENNGQRIEVCISPNPSSDRFTFIFSMPHQGHTSLKIQDDKGRIIAVILDEIIPRGDHHFTWDAEGFSPGIYFYNLTTYNHFSTGKMGLVR